MSTVQELFEFQLSFKGQLVENSVDAFDVANGILATSQSLQEIAEIHFGEQASQNLKLNISAFKKGSLESNFIYFFDAALFAAPVLIPVARDIVQTCTGILNGYETYLNIKKMLKGGRPEKITPINQDQIKIDINVNGNNNAVIIGYPDLRALQSPTLAKNTAKIAQLLTKDDSLLEEVILKKDKKMISSIDKDSAQYFKTGLETQVLPAMKLKGVVTKLDSKVRSGYISAGSKRIPFTYLRDLEQSQFEILAESLKKQVQIHIVGEVEMDFESEPRSVAIQKVESELKLL
ncbi:hypothetical protein GF391_03470 [Candidatus Uhrbacteria bacterium]|nr:hypothetical protein [Candidatus Uhrbacteria bacterium]